MEKAFEVSQHYMMLPRGLIMEQISFDEFGGAHAALEANVSVPVGNAGGGEGLDSAAWQGSRVRTVLHQSDPSAESYLMVKVSELLSVTRNKARTYCTWCLSGQLATPVVARGEPSDHAFGESRPAWTRRADAGSRRADRRGKCEVC